MKQDNQKRVAEILARGVARVRAIGVAEAAKAADEMVSVCSDDNMAGLGVDEDDARNHKRMENSQ